MDELLDMVVNDASASDITDKIKDILYTKSSERIDGMKPTVHDSAFAPEAEEAPESEE